MTAQPSHISEVRARQPRAIHSALVVLEEVARCGPGVTAREVSHNLSLPRATTYRLLNLLVQEEYLVRLPDLSGFALGSKVAQLAGLSPVVSRLPRAARDVVTELRQGIRGGVHLVRYEQQRLQVTDIDPDFPLSNPARIARFVDASAMGRLLLAELDAGQRLGVQAGPLSVERSPEAIDALVAETRARGYALQIGELTPGYGCLAVPIRDGEGALVAGLCLSAPATRVEHPGATLTTLVEGSRMLAPLLA
ncbi:IclR family transcriptional regulator [Subtercola sp. PAMC28395]|uniref:IclR family transcriptional regulator n=1 Tax=Subtercola sp. PAMC28395 TaxID=2846775 RepID=UPI00209AE135|nr:IclR family transcriptional regulator C-terminal domain-containing protein [Subtercola sp. PAMC28395]